MEYFKSGLKSVLGATQDAQPTPGEIVERLVDRVQTSTLLDDRRDACRALKALSTKFRLEIGAQAMDVLIRILECDRSDNEILSYAVEAICNIVCGAREDESQEYFSDDNNSLGLQFTEIFIKKPENVTLLLDLIEEYDFKVRWPVVKLLSGLLSNCPKELQECILVSPRGVSRLMDLLSDSREIIRNDTLLLLEHLTKSNANIQKIVAFENAFDKLLGIISEEGHSDGGVIVGDCLRVMLTILKNNTSNQTFFKEGSYIKYLTPFFQFQDFTERGWTSQKAVNMLIMLQIVRVLVSPNNPQQITVSAQKAMFHCGLLEQLCTILMTSGIPADVLTETINAVAELIRGSHSNQEYFATICAPMSPPRPAIVVLLMSMINEKQPFSLRCSVLYCFQCFLYRNEFGQAQMIQTLLPSTADVNTMTIGQLLCGGLFSADALSNWFAAVALSHALVDNSAQKEQLLRVQLATGVGDPAVSLFNHCVDMLQQGIKLQTRLGLLMLMSNWLANCTTAVMHFLRLSTNIPFLTSQVSLVGDDENEELVQGICAFLLGICVEFNDNSQPNFTKEDLCQLIMKRIGLETFLDKLTALTKNEHYSRAVQNPCLKFRKPSEVLLDYEFCSLVKSLEAIITKAVQPKPDLFIHSESLMTDEQQELLQHYKDVIRDQDQELNDLKKQLNHINLECEKSKAQFDDMISSFQQLKDQNSLLKAQLNVSAPGNSSDDVLKLKEEIESLKLQLSKVEKKTNESEDVCPNIELNSALRNLDLCVEHQKLIDDLNTSIEILRKENQRLRDENSTLHFQFQEVQNNMTNDLLLEEKNKLLREKSEAEEKLNAIKKEQEDMLIFLTEQEEKISFYKKRLKEIGEQVDDDSANEDSEFDAENIKDDTKDDGIKQK